ncbi:unnamed protein product [Didymodactylos carnosus]|uniref:Peptidase C14 caspase domain-containing protein n=1 Tax=Didymodactylos carnosus TaxID=1234261 RepID=A0A815YUE3_9BILA|nr:unnamed protein product [Didymodactylos carnosus]CAF1575024.1 unnamed protein product [Didymodactylos carnosus]CAF4061340.1 unnamed protein product [Didymodactylos carnosus]CAF4439894.1 unnamed protein product [Didymodactylos carnosus]
MSAAARGTAVSLPSKTKPEQRKLALVIGISQYAEDELKNPENDANDITTALEKVTKGLNLKCEEMDMLK